MKTFLLIFLFVLEHEALVTEIFSPLKSDSPLLMKIIQSVDVATSDEHLFDVTLKLLRSLCVCMRETLRQKEDKVAFNGETNSLQTEEGVSRNRKDLELYRKIYNNTCFNLRQELANKINKTHSHPIEENDLLFDHSNCGKYEDNETGEENTRRDLKDDIKPALENILYKALIETRDVHKYQLKRHYLFGKVKHNNVYNSASHSVIVIITLLPTHIKGIIEKNHRDVIDKKELHDVLHSNSSINIDIYDAKYDTKGIESEENETKFVLDCNLHSIYTFLIESEKKNLTKVYKILRKTGTIKIYIDVTTLRNHTDYTSICCRNGTVSICNKKNINDNFRSEESMANIKKTKQSIGNYKDTISKIKKLVKLYDKKIIEDASVTNNDINEKKIKQDNAIELEFLITDGLATTLPVLQINNSIITKATNMKLSRTANESLMTVNINEANIFLNNNTNKTTSFGSNFPITASSKTAGILKMHSNDSKHVLVITKSLGDDVSNSNIMNKTKSSANTALKYMKYYEQKPKPTEKHNLLTNTPDKQTLQQTYKLQWDAEKVQNNIFVLSTTESTKPQNYNDSKIQIGNFFSSLENKEIKFAVDVSHTQKRYKLPSVNSESSSTRMFQFLLDSGKIHSNITNHMISSKQTAEKEFITNYIEVSTSTQKYSNSTKSTVASVTQDKLTKSLEKNNSTNAIPFTTSSETRNVYEDKQTQVTYQAKGKKKNTDVNYMDESKNIFTTLFDYSPNSNNTPFIFSSVIDIKSQVQKVKNLFEEEIRTSFSKNTTENVLSTLFSYAKDVKIHLNPGHDLNSSHRFMKPEYEDAKNIKITKISNSTFNTTENINSKTVDISAVTKNNMLIKNTAVELDNQLPSIKQSSHEVSDVLQLTTNVNSIPDYDITIAPKISTQSLMDIINKISFNTENVSSTTNSASAPNLKDLSKSSIKVEIDAGTGTTKATTLPTTLVPKYMDTFYTPVNDIIHIATTTDNAGLPVIGTAYIIAPNLIDSATNRYDVFKVAEIITKIPKNIKKFKVKSTTEELDYIEGKNRFEIIIKNNITTKPSHSMVESTLSYSRATNRQANNQIVSNERRWKTTIQPQIEIHNVIDNLRSQIGTVQFETAASTNSLKRDYKLYQDISQTNRIADNLYHWTEELGSATTIKPPRQRMKQPIMQQQQLSVTTYSNYPTVSVRLNDVFEHHSTQFEDLSKRYTRLSSKSEKIQYKPLNYYDAMQGDSTNQYYSHIHNSYPTLKYEKDQTKSSSFDNNRYHVTVTETPKTNKFEVIPKPNVGETIQTTANLKSSTHNKSLKNDLMTNASLTVKPVIHKQSFEKEITNRTKVLVNTFGNKIESNSYQKIQKILLPINKSFASLSTVIYNAPKTATDYVNKYTGTNNMNLDMINSKEILNKRKKIMEHTTLLPSFSQLTIHPGEKYEPARRQEIKLKLRSSISTVNSDINKISSSKLSLKVKSNGPKIKNTLLSSTATLREIFELPKKASSIKAVIEKPEYLPKVKISFKNVTNKTELAANNVTQMTNYEGPETTNKFISTRPYTIHLQPRKTVAYLPNYTTHKIYTQFFMENVTQITRILNTNNAYHYKVAINQKLHNKTKKQRPSYILQYGENMQVTESSKKQAVFLIKTEKIPTITTVQLPIPSTLRTVNKILSNSSTTLSQVSDLLKSGKIAISERKNVKSINRYSNTHFKMNNSTTESTTRRNNVITTNNDVKTYNGIKDYKHSLDTKTKDLHLMENITMQSNHNSQQTTAHIIRNETNSSIVLIGRSSTESIRPYLLNKYAYKGINSNSIITNSKSDKLTLNSYTPMLTNKHLNTHDSFTFLPIGNLNSSLIKIDSEKKSILRKFIVQFDENNTINSILDNANNNYTMAKKTTQASLTTTHGSNANDFNNIKKYDGSIILNKTYTKEIMKIKNITITSMSFGQNRDPNSSITTKYIKGDKTKILQAEDTKNVNHDQVTTNTQNVVHKSYSNISITPRLDTETSMKTVSQETLTNNHFSNLKNTEYNNNSSIQDKMTTKVIWNKNITQRTIFPPLTFVSEPIFMKKWESKPKILTNAKKIIVPTNNGVMIDTASSTFKSNKSVLIRKLATQIIRDNFTSQTKSSISIHNSKSNRIYELLNNSYEITKLSIRDATTTKKMPSFHKHVVTSLSGMEILFTAKYNDGSTLAFKAKPDSKFKSYDSYIRNESFTVKTTLSPKIKDSQTRVEKKYTSIKPYVNAKMNESGRTSDIQYRYGISSDNISSGKTVSDYVLETLTYNTHYPKKQLTEINYKNMSGNHHSNNNSKKEHAINIMVLTTTPKTITNVEVRNTSSTPKKSNAYLSKRNQIQRELQNSTEQLSKNLKLNWIFKFDTISNNVNTSSNFLNIYVDNNKKYNYDIHTTSSFNITLNNNKEITNDLTETYPRENITIASSFPAPTKYAKKIKYVGQSEVNDKKSNTENNFNDNDMFSVTTTKIEKNNLIKIHQKNLFTMNVPTVTEMQNGFNLISEQPNITIQTKTNNNIPQSAHVYRKAINHSQISLNIKNSDKVNKASKLKQISPTHLPILLYHIYSNKNKNIEGKPIKTIEISNIKLEENRINKHVYKLNVIAETRKDKLNKNAYTTKRIYTYSTKHSTTKRKHDILVKLPRLTTTQRSKTIKYNTYKPNVEDEFDLSLKYETLLDRNIAKYFKNHPEAIPKMPSNTSCTFLRNLSLHSIPIKGLTQLLKAGNCTEVSKNIPNIVNDGNVNEYYKKVAKNSIKISPNKVSLLTPLTKTNLYPIKMVPPKIQRKVMRRIQQSNKKNRLMTMNTNDIFSQRRFVNKNTVKEIAVPHPRPVLIRKAVTSIPRHLILKPKFDTIDNLNANLKERFRPKPLYIQNNNDFHKEDFHTHHRASGITWREKVSYVQEALKQFTPNTEQKYEDVIEKPSYTAPITKPKFLRDRIDSIRNYVYNADFVKPQGVDNSEQYYFKSQLDNDSEEYYKPSVYNFRKKNWASEKTTTGRTTSRAVTDWWLDDMYLKVRLPLPINSNPGMVFPRRHFAKMEEVADLGALFIDDLLDYKEMLDRGELPLERATSREKGQPLCMEQFYRLLGVCRIPEVGRDRLELPRVEEGEESEELVVVACRNYFYPIPVKAVDRGRLTPGEIQAQLLHAMVEAGAAPPAPRVGLLTSMNRDQWARAREQLIKDENNRTNMELISRALCILCLDEAGGDRADTDADTNAMLRCMHGAGTRHHSANRWFDKTVQLIISSDGTVGMCYEHSAAEGVAVIRLAERALARAEVADRPAPPPVLLPAPQPMKWNITSDVQRSIEQAARGLDRAISDLDFRVYTYRGYGREFMKSCRTSPDVYIQLALQYAYYKMYGYLVTTYESASLRRFRNGRVDNIRSAQDAARAWAAAMCSAETSPLSDAGDDGSKKVSFNLYGEEKKLELFEEAARKQTAIMEANILGKGIDNHLLGLREAARETLGLLPQLFTDETYKQMIEYRLSTSQVATTTDGTFMGYGAVVPDGYGCSYNPKKESVIFCISSFTASSVTNTEAFRQSLEEALDSMKLMFQAKKAETA